jgi:MarR family transcriptional regulator, negative regulator of the multidrug operon emrRAB
MRMMTNKGLANAFGALALSISDDITSCAQRALARGGETSAALVVIGHIDGLKIDSLARVLELSHPGTVRVVDRLVADGLVRRDVGRSDRRNVELRLTASGTRKRTALLLDRQDVLDKVIAALLPVERSLLESVVARVLTSHVRNETEALRTCRFCNDRVCTDCPVERALQRTSSKQPP